jgi:hypothetical protein
VFKDYFSSYEAQFQQVVTGTVVNTDPVNTHWEYRCLWHIERMDLELPNVL